MPDLSSYTWAAPVLGIVSGILFGIVLQRGRVCFNSAFRDLSMTKDNFMFKAGLFAIALSSVAYLALAQFGLIKLAPPAFNWIALIVGGLCFGVGMVLAGGCASGTTYRVGEGFTTSWLAALVFAVFALATNNGFLKPITEALSKSWITIPNPNIAIYAGEKIGPTIASLLKINP